MGGTQTCKVVAEHDVQYPVQPVLDPPMTADDPGEGLHVEPAGAEVEPLLPLDGAIALGLALDHGDRGEAREAKFVGMASIVEQPVHLMADRVLTGFDAAVIGIDGLAALDV